MPYPNEIIFIQEGNYKRKYVNTLCPECGEYRLIRYDIAKKRNFVFPCQECSRHLNCGEKHGMWKGGRYESIRGYVRLKILKSDPFYCMTDKHGDVWEHRYIVAKRLGRPLETWEHIHHKNGIKNDNRDENLELVNNTDHAVITKLEWMIRKLQKENERLIKQLKIYKDAI